LEWARWELKWAERQLCPTKIKSRQGGAAAPPNNFEDYVKVKLLNFANKFFTRAFLFPREFE
jgi:hypothetical protein